MNVRRLLLLTVAAAALFALAPSAASAANLFASPTGDPDPPNDCTDSADPCSLVRAVNDVSVSGDDITLLDGNYPTISTTLGGGGAFNRTIHGAPGARPTINFDAASGGQNGIFLQAGSVIRDVVIESATGNGGSALFMGGGTIERVSVHETGLDASGPNTRACAFNPDTVIRDSVCWYSGAGGSNAVAVQAQSLFPSGTATLRNVTAIASNAPGLLVIASGNVSGPATMDVTATNVIVRGGGASGQEDVKTIVSNSALRATATLDHSNYESESEFASGDITNPGSPTNQTADPVFVNAAIGDFHQVGTSAGTINLGTANGLLPVERDFDGQYRDQGTNPDIGADELAEAPPAPTITGTNPSSGSNENNPLVIGSAEPLSMVDLYANGTCTGLTPASSDLAEVFASPGLAVSVADNSTTTFSATATNDAGTSPCSTVNVTYAEVTPPVVAPTPTPIQTAPGTTPKKRCKKGFVKKKVKGKKKCVRKKGKK